MKKSWKIPEHARCVFTGVIFDVWQWDQTMYDGSTKLFEIVKRKPTVVVLLRVGDAFLIQEEEQPHRSKPFLSLTSGRVEDGEDSLVAAKRELLEETGYEADHWKLWKEDYGSGKILWQVSVYVATGARKVAEPHLDPGEKITPRSVSFDELIRLTTETAFRADEIREECLRARYDGTYKAALLAELGGP
jgi:ADP-ribose pyrophosphatase